MKFKNLHKKCGCFTDHVRSKCGRKKCRRSSVSPLSEQEKTGRLKVCKVTGNRRLCAQMAALGVYPGEEMELICPENGHLCIVKIHENKITLDNDTTRSILVSDSL